MAGPLDDLTMGEYVVWTISLLIVGSLVGKFLEAVSEDAGKNVTGWLSERRRKAKNRQYNENGEKFSENQLTREIKFLSRDLRTFSESHLPVDPLEDANSTRLNIEKAIEEYQAEIQPRLIDVYNDLYQRGTLYKEIPNKDSFILFSLRVLLGITENVSKEGKSMLEVIKPPIWEDQSDRERWEIFNGHLENDPLYLADLLDGIYTSRELPVK